MTTTLPPLLFNALIVVDVQRDFCPGGSLPVDNGDQVAASIHDFLTDHGDEYNLVVATKDWHPRPIVIDRDEDQNPTGFHHFPHFSDTPNYINTWPVHCVAGTPGADFHPNLHVLDSTSVTLIPTHDLIGEHWLEFDAVFHKGQKSAAYSGFEGVKPGIDPPAGFETLNSMMEMTLDQHLKYHQIHHVDIVGLATDHCVFATAMDAVKNGYDTTVLLKLCAGVDPTTTETAIQQMREAGVHIDQ